MNQYNYRNYDIILIILQVVLMIIKGTSCYANAKSGNLVSITGDGGNAWGFYGNAYKKMSPRLYLWQYYD